VRAADRMPLPRLRRVLAGREVAHLTAGFAFLRRRGPPTHHQHALTGAEQVNEDWRLVAGAVRQQMFLPQARPALRVFVPAAWLTGEGNDDHIRPAIAVEVVREAGEALAIAVRVPLSRFDFGVVLVLAED